MVTVRYVFNAYMEHLKDKGSAPKTLETADYLLGRFANFSYLGVLYEVTPPSRIDHAFRLVEISQVRQGRDAEYVCSDSGLLAMGGKTRRKPGNAEAHSGKYPCRRRTTQEGATNGGAD